MTFLQAIILGIVEGVTEFLPISSTFHLLIATRLLGMEQTEFTNFFSVFIQAGAILAVVVLFAKEWFQSLEFLKKVVVSFIPTGVIGFLLHDVITGVFFESYQLMISVFVLVGLLFLWMERRFSKRPELLEKPIDQMSWSQAGIIGAVQAMAVLPGVSRAGAVMIGMMLLGYRRDEAAKYSFTLAVPTILAAAFLDAVKMRELFFQMEVTELVLIGVGLVTAFLSALIVIRWFIGFLRKRTFTVFGWYRIAAGALLFLLIH